MRFIGQQHLADVGFLLCLLALTSQMGFAGQCDVALLLEASRRDAEFTSDFPGAVPVDAVRVILRNVGRDPIVLVEPGDGSNPPGSRTPIVSWEIERGGRFSSSGAGGIGCGNRNALTAAEVFDLAPGATHILGSWVPRLMFPAPGSYRIRFHYIHDPRLRWTGGPLGVDDEAAMRRIRESMPCDLVSNVIELTVHPTVKQGVRSGP